MRDLLSIAAAGEEILAVWRLALALPVLLLFAGLVLVLARGYQRCPPNKVLVKFGKLGQGQHLKCIAGGATFVLPLIQDCAYLSLAPIPVEVSLADALSSEERRVHVAGTFTVAVGAAPELMHNAAIRLLGLDTSQVEQQAADVILAQLRQTVAALPVANTNHSRGELLERLQTALAPELHKLGLVLINVNLTNLVTEPGSITHA
ncbi:MAG: flotillin family protein [Gemmataceae bacterium]|nr:flotillin family protein [Gemmataceae bacterium]